MNARTLAAAAAGLVGLGALAYFYDQWHKKGKKKYIEFDKRIKEIKTLRDPRGQFSIPAVTKMVSLISSESEKEFQRSTQSVIRLRRKQLKEANYDGYLETAQECADTMKEVEDGYLKRALDKLGLEREEYEEELSKMPPQALQMIMAGRAAPKSGEDVPLPYTLNKFKTKEIFMEITSLQDKTNAKWKELLEKIETLIASMDQMAANETMMVLMQFLVSDILFVEYKITDDQYSAALQKFRIMEDPEIARMMQQKAAMYQMMMMMNGAGQ